MRMASTVALIALTTPLMSTAQAMQIQQFDRMAGRDQIAYVDQLAQSVEDASKGDLLPKVKRFFMPKQSGEAISGMGRFELNLALARIVDLDAATKNPEVRRLEVEDVMYVTLERSGVALSKNFRPTASTFRPKLPPSKKAMTRDDATKALAQARAWAARSVPEAHEFRAKTLLGLSGFPSDDKAMGFYADYLALAAAASKAGVGSGSGGSSHGGDPWWEASGYSSYHEAVHSACMTSTTSAHPSCN
jgi:hypothetical protein